MIERKTLAQSYMIEAGCACGGSLIFTGIAHINTTPLLYLHKCDKCENTENLIAMFPQLRLEKQEKPALSVVTPLKAAIPITKPVITDPEIPT